MKKTIILIFLLALLLISNMFLPSRSNSKNREQVSLKIVQAMADENPEDYFPDPGEDPIPNGVIPPGRWIYLIYR